jgi:hypothetical protein
MPKPAEPVAAPGRRAAPDGYLRVSGRELLQVRLGHLLSGLDEDPPDSLSRGLGATHATLAGFTEWSEDRSPAVSVGWDWRAGGPRCAQQYLRIGLPRTNLMLIDVRGRDLGFDLTAHRVAQWLDRQPWQVTVAAFLSKIYA